MTILMALAAVLALHGLSGLRVLTPSKRYANLYTATFTPTGGSAITITGLKKMKVGSGISNLKESADGDAFMTALFTDMQDPTVELELIDPFAFISLLGGVEGTLSVTAGDSRNLAAAGGGAKVITLSLARLDKDDKDLGHRQFGTGAVAFCGRSADGVTSPLAIAAA